MARGSHVACTVSQAPHCTSIFGMAVRRSEDRVAPAAVVLPADGKSYVVLSAISLGYVATAAWYARATVGARD